MVKTIEEALARYKEAVRDYQVSRGKAIAQADDYADVCGTAVASRR